ncbi:Hypothetical predicted protein [Octopus vulgaris]|uniref:Uncharacterized protein n=1 Tax=Octopus vulgaris TaxID=6645 RepID=A0AA36FEI9_OCTVU|nr:Hypothetical predicted protein [Octopus vulgaris]
MLKDGYKLHGISGEPQVNPHSAGYNQQHCICDHPIACCRSVRGSLCLNLINSLMAKRHSLCGRVEMLSLQLHDKYFSRPPFLLSPSVDFVKTRPTLKPSSLKSNFSGSRRHKMSSAEEEKLEKSRMGRLYPDITGLDVVCGVTVRDGEREGETTRGQESGG